MSAEIINLRQARKARARAEKELAAEENRLRHGRTRAERASAEAERKRQKRTLDGVRRDQQAGRADSGGEDENDLDPGSVS